MTKTIGVIGLGSIGMRHATNLRTLGYHVWGCDPDVKKRLDLGYNFCGSNIEQILTADAIVVASPTNLHQKHYMDIVIKGGDIPVFMEKPIAHVYDPMLNNVKMVGYNLRFHSCVKKAKKWIPLIGPIQWAQFTVAQYNDKPTYRTDGVILNWSHEIDLALYLLGGGSVAGSSTRLNNGHDDITDILLVHDNGCRTSIHMDYVTKREQRHFIIVGREGMIKVNLLSRFAWCDVGPDGGINFQGEDSWDQNYVEEMQAFIDRIDGKETIGCTGEEALEVLEICLAVRKQAGLEPIHIHTWMNK